MSKLSELDRIKGSKILAIITISQSQLECQDYDSLEFMQWPPCTVPGKEKRLAVLYQCPSGKIRLLKLSCSMDTALSQVGRFLGSTWEKVFLKWIGRRNLQDPGDIPGNLRRRSRCFLILKGPMDRDIMMFLCIVVYRGMRRENFLSVFRAKSVFRLMGVRKPSIPTCGRPGWP